MMMYTVDQMGYALGFDPDRSHQFMLCRSCIAKARAGLNTLESELTFYAFSIQETRTKKVPVRYVVVPNARDNHGLESCVLSVAKASRGRVSETAWSLQEMMKQGERKRDQSLELSETLSVLPHELSYTVVFFTVERPSGMKKVLGSYFFPGTRLREINKILSETASGFELDNQTSLKTERLYHLMGSKVLTDFFAALFLGTRVDRQRLVKAAVLDRADDQENTLREHFLKMIRERSPKNRAKERGSVSAKLRDLLTMYDVLHNNGLLGGESDGN
jgi:hypothetical protein